MIKKQIILPTKKFFKSEEEDLNVRIDLSKEDNLLRENEKNIELDLSRLFDKERNQSKSYRINGKLKMVFKNSYSGTTDYTYLKDRLYLVSDGDGTDPLFVGSMPYNEFAFLRRDLLREINIPNSGSTITNFSQNIILSGYTGHTTVTAMSAPYHNWNLYLSYVYSGDTSYGIKYTLSNNTTYNFTAGDGIPFRLTTGNTYYTLTAPVPHGMSTGEYIVISGGTLNNTIPLSGRTFHIDEVGNEVYRSEQYVISLLKSQFSGTPFTNNSVILGKRCIDKLDITGTTSQYYVHKHKTLTSVDDYIMDKAGFESSIWEDEKKLVFENFSQENDVLVEGNRMESILFSFKNPFVLTGITNNFKYTPTEIYLSVIFRNGNGFFNYPPKVGYQFNFHSTWIDQHFSGTTSNESSLTGNTFTRSSITFTSGNTIPIGTTLIGAFVEYNPVDFKERIISEALHKFTSPITIFDHSQSNPNFYSGASIDNMAGLFYQPHYRIKLRELSPYIETSATDDILNLPENVIYDSKSNLWKWRDLYDHGYVDTDGYGTNFPFVNNSHYVTKNINFYLKNEKDYTNKIDGIASFDNKNIDC